MRRALLLAFALAACGPHPKSDVPGPEAAFRSGHALLLADNPAEAAHAFALARRTGSEALEPKARYWEAFSRFRIGTPGELEEARRLLAPLILSRPQDPDAAALELRILSRLAGGADPGSAEVLADRVETLIADCHGEDPYMRALALAGLLHAEPVRGWDLLERALDGTTCPSTVRHNALYVVPAGSGGKGVKLLARVAREDPDTSVRLDAAFALQRFADLGGLDDLLSLWDAADTRAMKEQLLAQFAALDDPAGGRMLWRIQWRDPEREIRFLARVALVARWTGAVDRLLPL